MTWVKIDDGFADHPKTLKIGPLGIALHIRGLCYASRYLTDGFLPVTALQPMMCDLDALVQDTHGADSILDSLIVAGVWKRSDDGFQIHDYLVYNPSRERVMRERAATSARVSKLRNGVGNGSGNAVGNTTPVPVPSVNTNTNTREGGASRPAPIRKPKDLPEVQAFWLSEGLYGDPEVFWTYRENHAWKWKSWKADAKNWALRDSKKPTTQPRNLGPSTPNRYADVKGRVISNEGE